VGYQCYQSTLTGPQLKFNLPDGFKLHQVNEALIAEDFEGKEELLEEMCSERESVEAFLAQSFGIVAFKEGALAGWCLSEYNYEKRCEVGIATLPPFQRQGLASAMTFAFLNLAHDQGTTIVLWHCFNSNIPSQKTALSAGFKLVEDEQVLVLYLDRGVNLTVQGDLCFKAEDYLQALVWYQKALVTDAPQSWMA